MNTLKEKDAISSAIMGLIVILCIITAFIAYTAIYRSNAYASDKAKTISFSANKAVKGSVEYKKPVWYRFTVNRGSKIKLTLDVSKATTTDTINASVFSEEYVKKGASETKDKIGSSIKLTGKSSTTKKTGTFYLRKGVYYIEVYLNKSTKAMPYTLLFSGIKRWTNYDEEPYNNSRETAVKLKLGKRYDFMLPLPLKGTEIDERTHFYINQKNGQRYVYVYKICYGSRANLNMDSSYITLHKGKTYVHENTKYSSRDYSRRYFEFYAKKPKMLSLCVIKKLPKVKGIKVKTKGSKIKITWKKQKGVDGYEVCYNDIYHRGGLMTAKTVKGKNKNKCTIKNTRRRKYLTVYSYKNVMGKRCYSAEGKLLKKR